MARPCLHRPSDQRVATAREKRLTARIFANPKANCSLCERDIHDRERRVVFDGVDKLTHDTLHVRLCENCVDYLVELMEGR